jgi:hypothetical protein
VASGLLANGQTFTVTGSGLPDGGYQATIDSSHPSYLLLPGTETTQATAQPYFLRP